MSGQARSGRYWPDEPLWTRKLRCFRGRINDDPDVSHLLARLHTEANLNGSGVATTAVMLGRDGKPTGDVRFENTGPTTPTPGRTPGADLELGAKADWGKGELVTEVSETVDMYIKHSQAVSNDWHVLHTGRLNDFNADWLLLYARSPVHAVRKPSFPSQDRWGDQLEVEYIGTWIEFRSLVADGETWNADGTAVSLDLEAPNPPPEDVSEVIPDASE